MRVYTYIEEKDDNLNLNDGFEIDQENIMLFKVYAYACMYTYLHMYTYIDVYGMII